LPPGKCATIIVSRDGAFVRLSCHNGGGASVVNTVQRSVTSLKFPSCKTHDRVSVVGGSRTDFK